MTPPLYHPRPERWPQLSLKGLFVLVTLACVSLGWLGLQVKWKRGRHALLAEGAFLTSGVRFNWGPVVQGEQPCKAPWSLRLLGEEPIQWFAIDPDSPTKDADRQRLEELFPESEISEWVYR